MKNPITDIRINSRLLGSVMPALITAFSVFYMLYFLEAFGIQKGFSYSGHSLLFRTISFALLSGLYIGLVESLIRPALKINTAVKLILWYLIVVFIGSQLIFILFNAFWNWQEWNWSAYSLIIKEFPFLMLVPIVFYNIINQFRTKKTDKEQRLSFSSENGKDRLAIKLQDFLFAQSAENYVSISYRAGSKIKKHLIRKPLKEVENELREHSQIIRCHRSYLINQKTIAYIKEDKGRLSVYIGEESIPVSPQWQKDLIPQ